MRAKRWKERFIGVDPLDFPPGLLRIQTQPPTLFARIGLLLIWAAFVRLGVSSSAPKASSSSKVTSRSPNPPSKASFATSSSTKANTSKQDKC